MKTVQMSFNEYCTKTRDFNCYKTETMLPSLVAGLCEEFEEWKTAKEKSYEMGLAEVGDFQWYRAELVNLLGEDVLNGTIERAQWYMKGKSFAEFYLGTIKRTLRGDSDIVERVSSLVYVCESEMILEYGSTYSSIVSLARTNNIDKLNGRKSRGTIKGTGDKR